MPEHPPPPSDRTPATSTAHVPTVTPPGSGAPRTMVGTPPEDALPGGRDGATLLPSLQAALAGQYVIERELGGGGMSRVFVATETALGRTVAIKVLSPELFQGVSAERFAREVALAARLQDAHIVPVLATGSTPDGLPWYTMPFIEGESLRGRMERGAVPVEEALRILRDVAEALEYAHARGVVHRDIKPDNVLLSGRNALVADFGIAKAVSAVRAAVPQGTLTSIGLSLGTPAYMAPEQAAGDAVDHRVDVYAWGMMAWELLAGRHPYAPRTTAAQLMAAQLTELPAPLDEVRPGLPPALGALVMRCVAKAPEERPADIATVLALLGGATTDVAVTSGRRAPVAAPAGRNRAALAGGAAVLLALAAGGAWYAQRGDAGSGATDGAATAAADATPSLAVLPFEHQGDSADAYLTAGITDEIRNKLAGVQNLVVIARASSMQYKGKTTSPQQIAKELGVRWLLTGTVQVVGTGDQRRVLVRPELVEVTPDGRLQSKGGTPFDGPLTDVVKAQGEIAGQVVSSMEVAVGGSDRAKLVEVPTTNAEAYDLYLRGMAAIGGGAASDVASLTRGVALFEQALARDSTLVEAGVRLAIGLGNLYGNGTPSPALAARARAAVARLERLAPGSASALRARASVQRSIDGDLPGALADLERARRLAPGDALVLSNLATIKGELGQFAEALADNAAAVRLDPRMPGMHANRARLLLRLRRLTEARAAAERARALAPAALLPLLARIMVEVAAGDAAAARRVFESAAADIPLERRLAYIGTYYEVWWVAAEADQRRLTTIGLDAYGGDVAALTTVRAQVHAALGEAAAARSWADSAVRISDAELRDAPDDAQRHVFRGLMLGYAGRAAEALAGARRGLALHDAVPARRMDAAAGYFHLVAAHAALLAGDRAQAIAWVREGLARRPYMNAAWVRLDPAFAPLRGDPEFERVLAEAP